MSDVYDKEKQGAAYTDKRIVSCFTVLSVRKYIRLNKYMVMFREDK